MNDAKYRVAVIGLGYVGLHAAVGFAKHQHTIGYDIDSVRIEELKKGFDRNQEIDPAELSDIQLELTADPQLLSKANFYIVAVPSPLNFDKEPELKFLKNASRIVAQYLKKSDVVVYESTVYPGATETAFIPVLEEVSGLKSGVDFFVGYSPERINPGDKINTLSNTPKIISGQTDEALKIISAVYSPVVQAGVYPVSSMKTAEATKLTENIQRDINIATMNELAVIFNHLGIDTYEVIEAAAKTKWNFVPFKPGLVGGHCVRVNPYYLAHQSMLAGHYPHLIFAARKVNESMCHFVVRRVIAELELKHKQLEGAKIGVLGLAYKEDISFVSDTLVADLVHLFNSLGADVLVHDPFVSAALAKKEYHFDLKSLEQLTDLDVLVMAVSHASFKQLAAAQIKGMLKSEGMIVDLKGFLKLSEYQQDGITVWRL